MLIKLFVFLVVTVAHSQEKRHAQRFSQAFPTTSRVHSELDKRTLRTNYFLISFREALLLRRFRLEAENHEQSET